ncbi:MAG: aminopeptidase N [Legionellales bacterium RIFCSPHIGHO2_12_FULL_37_14]|nr:MAG: aminopeptidase N [Legionellales bacterium RIFCSPHIGHO2_12_FULL_37_14]
MPSKTIYRKDYRPYPFQVESLELDFDLHKEKTILQAVMRLKRLDSGPLHLYGDDLNLISISLNGKKLFKEEYKIGENDLIIENAPDSCEIIIKTELNPKENTKLSGLYLSNGIFCTQCEAEGFRRMTYFPDRPDVLTTYRTKITADKEEFPVLLSNGNLIKQGESPNGKHWVLWEDPFKKPSYLFALVAGDLSLMRDSYTTKSGRAIELRIYAEKGESSKCSHAMEALKHAMRWDEVNYGREYDLEVYMIVAVSDFNMGAMENKGLNIFNAKYILVSPRTATDLDYENVEGVVAHEYFHNWTGNRVTCRDWFQLSLKEGLTVFRDQSFSQDQFARDVKRIEDVKIIRNIQFPEDDGPMAHPVRPESYEEINNFYTTTVYNKGAEVIRMQQTILGVDGFRKGMNLYFERNDGKAVTIDDFVAAMEDANNVDLAQFKYWYSQAGTPQVSVTKELKNGKISLFFKQHNRFWTTSALIRPFHIPIKIAAFTPSGEQLTLPKTLLELKHKEQAFDLDIPEDSIISLLRDFSAPIKLNFTQTEDEQLAIMKFETDGFAKWYAVQNLALNCLTNGIKNQGKIVLPEKLADAYRSILTDPKLDKALCAELLTPPLFEDLAALCEVVDVDLVEDARTNFQIAVANAISEIGLKLIEESWKNETHLMTTQAFASRRLRHIVLSLLCKADNALAFDLCEEQFYETKTMADEAAALYILAASKHSDKREAAKDSFYTKWSNHDLVLDKWFAAIGSADLPETLARIENLLSHPKFKFNQPNKVRALIGSFCFANHRQFHQKNGEGYAFLADMVLKLDLGNPQVAARMVTPFTRFRRYDKARKDLMHEWLVRLSKQNLSKDVSEIVLKTLAT